MRTLEPWLRHLFLLAFGLLLGVLVLEGLLRLYTAFRAPKLEPIIAVTPVERTIADERLGHRPNPAYPGHDARGWRNVFALATPISSSSEILKPMATMLRCLRRPHRLAVHLRQSVYQMAYGGYGPAHYAALLDEALTLEPKVILGGYYFGNDIYDSYWLVYRVGSAFGKYKRSSPDPVLDALATSDPGVHAAIAHAESRDPKHLRAWYLDCAQPPFQGLDSSQLLRGPISPPREEIEQKPSASRTPPRRILSQWLTERSLVYRTVWPRVRPRLTVVLGEPAAAMDSPGPLDYGSPLCVHYTDGALRTIFQAGYRFIAIDDSDPREVEGERISLLAFKHIAKRARRAGIHFYVVLIPTKETAFRARAEKALRNERLLVDLWQPRPAREGEQVFC